MPAKHNSAMCILFVAWQFSQTDTLVVAANRDEFLNRPSLQAHHWDDAPHILAGRDVEHRGTWIGVTAGGRFAAVTNYREPGAAKGQRSRGELTAHFLGSDTPPMRYLHDLQTRAADYAGFNLLVADNHTLGYFSNRENTAPQALPPGVYGLSNHLLDSAWPKVSRGRDIFAGLIKRFAGTPLFIDDESRAPFFSLLQSELPAEDTALPETGVGLDMERALSSIFVRLPNYGTRTSTLITLNHHSGRLIEKSWDRQGTPTHELVFP